MSDDQFTVFAIVAIFGISFLVLSIHLVVARINKQRDLAIYIASFNDLEEALGEEGWNKTTALLHYCSNYPYARDTPLEKRVKHDISYYSSLLLGQTKERKMELKLENHIESN